MFTRHFTNVMIETWHICKDTFVLLLWVGSLYWFSGVILLYRTALWWLETR